MGCCERSLKQSYTLDNDELSVHPKFAQEVISIDIDLFNYNAKLRDFTTRVTALTKIPHFCFTIKKNVYFHLVSNFPFLHDF